MSVALICALIYVYVCVYTCVYVCQCVCMGVCTCMCACSGGSRNFYNFWKLRHWERNFSCFSEAEHWPITPSLPVSAEYLPPVHSLIKYGACVFSNTIPCTHCCYMYVYCACVMSIDVCTLLCTTTAHHRYLHFSPPPLKLSGILVMEKVNLLQELLIMYVYIVTVFFMPYYRIKQLSTGQCCRTLNSLS